MKTVIKVLIFIFLASVLVFVGTYFYDSYSSLLFPKWFRVLINEYEIYRVFLLSAITGAFSLLLLVVAFVLGLTIKLLKRK